jgi:anti-sigma factor RsiW
MNCRSFRTYLGAFADGELNTERNLEALEHLNMCEPCARRVSEVEHLKSALVRVWSARGASDSLRLRVQRVLARQQAPERKVAELPRFLDRMVAPLTVAAAVVLAALIWRIGATPGRDQSNAPFNASQAALDVREQHRLCAPLGKEHNDPSLPRDPEGIRRALGTTLHLRVLAPDLTAFGYELIGADRCGLRGRVAAHILYQSRSRRSVLSIFTVGLNPQFDPSSMERIGGRAYFVSEDENLSVVAWHSGGQTYIVCAPVSADEVLALADPLRGFSSAARPRSPGRRLARGDTTLAHGVTAALVSR